MLKNAYRKQRHGIWQNTLLRVLLLFFIFGLVLISAVGFSEGNRVEAATSSTLNFQGRLLTNTGGLVPDGAYTMEFKIYDSESAGASAPGVCSLNSSSDDCWWRETRTVTVQNGYYSVYLGDVAAGGTAFTAGLPWDQELWLTMNVNNDGEMTPRFKLTAVPYAFRAGALVDSSGTEKTADDFAQLAPNNVQAVNAAVSALRISQAGSGGFLQFQNGGTDVFSVSNTGATTLGSSTIAGLLRLHDGTTHTTSLQAGDSITDLTFTLPSTTGTAGQCIKTDGSGVLSFEDCGTGGGGGGSGGGNAVTVVKSVDESVTNNTLQNDDELSFPIGANETWSFRFVLLALAPATPDIRFAVTAPGGSICTMSYIDAEAAVTNGSFGCGVATPLVTGNNVNDIYEVVGTVTSGATAGTVNLQWAQNTSNAAATIVRAGSYLVATSNGASTPNQFVNGGNSFGGTAALGTNDPFGLNIITNGATTASFLASGGVEFVNDVEVGNGLSVLAGGIDVNNGGITNAGAISGISSLSGTGGVLGIDSGTLERVAPGFTTLDLVDAGATGLQIINSDAVGDAWLSVEGFVTSGLGFIGQGSFIFGIDATNISTGTLSDSRLSTNVALLGANQTFTGLPTFGSGLILANSTSTTAGALRFNGTDFEGYDGIQWVSLTSGSGSGGGGATQMITVAKTANEIQNSVLNPTAAFQNDDELTFPIAANETWSFRFEVQANSPATPDIKFAVSAPSGATCQLAFADEENAVSNANVGCGVTLGPISTAGTNELYQIVGTVTNGANAGNVTLQWAQNTANVANTTVFAGSYLTASSGDEPVSGSEYVQGGNAFGATAVIGTTDAEDFNLISNGVTQLSLNSAGQAVFTGAILANGGMTIGNAASDGLTIVSDSVSLINGLNFDNNTLTIDSANDYIGINTATPLNRLSVNTALVSDPFAQALVSTGSAANKGLVIQGVTSQSGNLFELQNENGTALGGFSATGDLVLGQSTVSSAATIARSVILPDESGTICLSSSISCGFLPFASGVFATDTSNNTTIAINKTTATGDLLALQRNGGAVFTVANSGALQIQSSSSTALDIRNTGGSSYFTVDTTTGQVRVGPATADGVGVLFTLDTKNTAGDPTGVDGSMYYNASLGKFRCYQDGAWIDCIGTRQIRSFIDTTSDAAADNNTTDYWDTAAENNNSVPNIAPSSTLKAITGMVSFETQSTTTADRSIVARVERSIGTPAACNSGTPVGTILSTFTTNNGEQASNTMMFLDTPATTSDVFYTLCADSATSSAFGMTINRIRITLEEANNTN